MDEELFATECFGILADDLGVDREPFQALEETTVALVVPTYETRPSPTTPAKLIQSAVIADSKRHVRLDTRRTRPPERSPRLEAGRMFGGNFGDRCPSDGRISRNCVRELCSNRLGKRGQDRFGWSATRHVDRLVAHMRSLRIGCWQTRCVMDLSSFDAQSARDASLIAMVVGVVGVLLVLKFVSSLVTKLLLSALFAGVIWLGFTQRDDLTACVGEIQARVEKGDTSDITCSFLGRDVTVEIPFQQGG